VGMGEYHMKHDRIKLARLAGFIHVYERVRVRASQI